MEGRDTTVQRCDDDHIFVIGLVVLTFVQSRSKFSAPTFPKKRDRSVFFIILNFTS
jgi:hypothetical protein